MLSMFPREMAQKRIFENELGVSGEVCKFIVDVANASIKERGAFKVGLSGMTCHFLVHQVRIQDFVGGLLSGPTVEAEGRVLLPDLGHH